MTEKLETISDLENKNRKLADEKRKVETSLEFLNTNFKVLHESVARLEDDSKLLVSLAAFGRGNNDGESPAAEPMVTDFEDEDEEASSESEVKGSSSGIKIMHTYLNSYKYMHVLNASLQTLNSICAIGYMFG